MLVSRPAAETVDHVGGRARGQHRGGQHLDGGGQLSVVLHGEGAVFGVPEMGADDLCGPRDQSERDDEQTRRQRIEKGEPCSFPLAFEPGVGINRHGRFGVERRILFPLLFVDLDLGTERTEK